MTDALAIDLAPRRPRWRAASSFALLMTACSMLRPLRDALMIEAGLDNVALAMVLTLAATAAAAPLLVWLAGRFPPRIVTSLCFAAFSFLLLAFVLLHESAPSQASARILAVLISTAGFILASAFWGSLEYGGEPRGAGEISLVATAGSLGALAGPSLSLLLLPVGAVPLACLAALLLAASGMLLPASTDRAPDGSGGSRDGRGLALIGAFIMLTNAGGTFVYVQQLALVAGSFATTAERATFFACAELASAILLLLLSLSGRRAASPVAVPAAITATLLLLAAWPGLAAAFAALTARRLVEQSTARPARELAYDALGSRSVRRLRLPVDSLSGRAGDAAAAIASLAGGLAGLLGGLLAAAALIPVSMRIGRLIEERKR